MLLREDIRGIARKKNCPPKRTVLYKNNQNYNNTKT